jgi:hypothetical protein
MHKLIAVLFWNEIKRTNALQVNVNVESMNVLVSGGKMADRVMTAGLEDTITLVETPLLDQQDGRTGIKYCIQNHPNRCYASNTGT